MDGYIYKPKKVTKNIANPRYLESKWGVTYSHSLLEKIASKTVGVSLVEYVTNLPVSHKITLYKGHQRFSAKYIPEDIMNMIYSITAVGMREVRDDKNPGYYRIVSGGNVEATSPSLAYIEKKLNDEHNYYTVYKPVPKWYFDKVMESRFIPCHGCCKELLRVPKDYHEEYCCSNKGCKCRGELLNPVLCTICLESGE